MPAGRKKAASKSLVKFPQILFDLGLIFLGLAGLIFALTFWPIIKLELDYSVSKPVTTEAPIDREFGIVISKIKANAKVVPNVDPFNSKIYQKALTRGVAHAKGSVFPGRPGNSFIFAHSSENFYEALRYNSVFYLLNKLEKGDQIEIYFNQKQYTYVVEEKKFVQAADVNYLNPKTDRSLLTLMTCWPPWTNLKRLLIINSLVK